MSKVSSTLELDITLNAMRWDDREKKKHEVYQRQHPCDWPHIRRHIVCYHKTSVCTRLVLYISRVTGNQKFKKLKKSMQYMRVIDMENSNDS